MFDFQSDFCIAFQEMELVENQYMVELLKVGYTLTDNHSVPAILFPTF